MIDQPTRPHRTAQISPDRWFVGVAAIVLVVLIMGASYVFSYVAIAEAGEWTGVPGGIHWIAPIFIDGAILTYTLSLAVFQARGAPRRTIRRTYATLWGFTLLSVVLNFAHTGSYWRWDFSQHEAWFGCLIAVAAPIAALLAAEEVVRLAFDRSRQDAPDSRVTTADTSATEQSADDNAAAEHAETPAVASELRLPERPAQAPVGAPAPDGELTAELASAELAGARIPARPIEGPILQAGPGLFDASYGDDTGEWDGIVRHPVEGEIVLAGMRRYDDDLPL